MGIGIVLKELLKTKGMTAKELSIQTGISINTLYAIFKRDNDSIKPDLLSKICAALDVPPSYLMGWDTAGTLPLHRKGVKINVLGHVAAGIPLEAVTDIIDTEEIPEEMARTGEFFGLRIRGDSMEPKISDGDIVIVRQQNDAETGEVVIATVNGDEATCKRLRKYRDGIELISTNPSYEPMFFSNDEIEKKPVKIIGRVVELRAKF